MPPLYRHRARKPVLGEPAIARPLAPGSRLERLERGMHLAQGGPHAATVAGPGDDIGFELDPRRGRARGPEEASANAADDHDLGAGFELLDPRRGGSRPRSAWTASRARA